MPDDHVLPTGKNTGGEALSLAHREAAELVAGDLTADGMDISALMARAAHVGAMWSQRRMVHSPPARWGSALRWAVGE
jgi:hypothetical protein